MFEFPINKEKNFVIKWEDFKLIEIKRGGKKSFLQQYFFPNKIFSYKIIFFGPKKSMNINDGCRMFHIRKVAEIIKYLLKYAEIKNKKVEMEREVENFLAKYY